MFHNCNPKKLEECNDLKWFDICIVCISLLNILSKFFNRKDFNLLIENNLPLLKKYIEKHIINNKTKLSKFLNIVYDNKKESVTTIYMLIVKNCKKYFKN